MLFYFSLKKNNNKKTDSIFLFMTELALLFVLLVRPALGPVHPHPSSCDL